MALWRRPARRRDIIKKLNVAINEGLATDEMQKTINNAGSEAKPNTPEEFAEYIAAQAQDLDRREAKRPGVKID